MLSVQRGRFLQWKEAVEGTRGRKLCHHVQAPHEVLSSPVTAVLGCSLLPVCGWYSHPPRGCLGDPLTTCSHFPLPPCSTRGASGFAPLREGKRTFHLVQNTTQMPPCKERGPEGSHFPLGKHPPSQTNKWENWFGSFCSGADFYLVLKIKQTVANKTSTENSQLLERTMPLSGENRLANCCGRKRATLKQPPAVTAVPMPPVAWAFAFRTASLGS